MVDLLGDGFSLANDDAADYPCIADMIGQMDGQ